MADQATPWRSRTIGFGPTDAIIVVGTVTSATEAAEPEQLVAAAVVGAA